MSSSALTLALQGAALLLLSGALYAAYWLIIAPLSSPLRLLPGPRFRGFFNQDHLQMILHGEQSAKINEQLVAKFGRNIRIKGIGWWEDRFFTLDPVAVAHVMNRSSDYQKPWQSRRLIASLIGDGLLATEGPQHRIQRRICNPTFAQQNIRALIPLFFSKAHELRDKWMDLLTSDEPPEKIDPNHWFGRATFDIIGVAGFDYDFGAIHDETNEVYRAYRDMFEVAVNGGQSLKSVAAIYCPLVDILVPDHRTRVVNDSQRVISALGRRMIEEKKAAINSEGKGTGKDLLTLLLKSNMSTDISADQRISDQDMLNQINTFLFAGSDTTALAMTWILYHLTQQPDIQARLREELQTVPNDTDPTEHFAAIDGLHCLDNVIREGLRLVSPVHSTLRVAMKDDEIPVSEAVKMKDGTTRWSVKIRKGQFVHVAMEGFNLDRTAWGQDAWDFKPDRWDNLPESANGQPGIYSHTMTFSMGPRACIGYRFSIMEMKIFLYVLLTRFEFSDSDTIFKANVVLTRPYVKGRSKEGSQLPMRVTPLPDI
ncbi:cytochrome P450 [Exidia glandulosa HHB12029]|uniref:Cytochrome P450 n=1 Tax=Exidia glandulosa HHB12029 TaxID=1314781 RepID=A0A165N6H8_EXIGL|nr:cytochrome P450 [Exidia glandulosa HHB12029]